MLGENRVDTYFVVKCNENTFIDFYSDVMVHKRSVEVKIRYVGELMYGYFSFYKRMNIDDPTYCVYNEERTYELIKRTQAFKEQQTKEYNELFDELYNFMKSYTDKFTNIKDKTFIAFKGWYNVDPMYVYHDITNLDGVFEYITTSDEKRKYFNAVDCLSLKIPETIEDTEFDKYRNILNGRICDKTEKNYVFKPVECVHISSDDMVKLYADYGYAVDSSICAYTQDAPSVKELLAEHFNKKIVTVDDRYSGYYITMEDRD